MFKQTWWDNNLNSRLNEYLSWLGDKDTESRIFIRNFIKNKCIKSMVDFGCGPAIEYTSLLNEKYPIIYLGVDSCIHIKEINENKNIPFLYSNIEETNITSNSYELSYSRHVLEHLDTYKILLNEMIRIANTYVLNIFFIKPSENEIINYCNHDNLYHNVYSKIDIESTLKLNPKVKEYTWVNINKNEIALIINM
jgi:ubiquinone/menaquinone biosynthesis C-methylase UbiE